jgi:hypothetical protein
VETKTDHGAARRGLCANPCNDPKPASASIIGYLPSRIITCKGFWSLYVNDGDLSEICLDENANRNLERISSYVHAEYIR